MIAPRVARSILVIALLCHTGAVRDLDISLFRWINRWPDELEPFFRFLSEATKIWPGRILLAAVLIFCLSRPRLRTAAILGLLAFPLANECCDLLKNSLRMPRPCVELPGVLLRGDLLTSFGTASAHSANMACIAAVFWTFDRKWGLAWTLVAFFTGLSRIYTGVHYPSQVLLGWAVGAVVGRVAVFVYERFIPKKTGAEPSSAPDSSSTP